MSRIRAFWPFAAAALLVLAACGGGGDSGGAAPSAPPATNPPPSNPPPSNPPPTPAASVSYSATTLAVTADTSGSAATDQSIVLTVANRPSGSDLYTRLSQVSGPALGDASLAWSSSTQANLKITPLSPRVMGAGLYVSVVKVEVCSDNACTQQITGSPTNITVNYTVTGSPIPLTQVHWFASPLVGADLTSNETRAPNMKLRVSVTDLPPTGLHLVRTNSATGLITSMELGPPNFAAQVGTAFGEYSVTLKPPATLGSGIFTDTVDVKVCFDQACTREVPNSTHTLSFRVMITATAGVEYARRVYTPANGATSVVWSGTRQSLYVVSSENAPVGATPGVDPVVLPVNPLTAQAGTGVTVAGENLARAVVTDEGSYLYVASRTNPAVHRFALASLAHDLTIPMGTTGSAPYLVSDMAVVPGQPQALLVAVTPNVTDHGGTRVYDNAVLRADVIAPQAGEFSRWLVPGATAGTYLSQSVGQTPAFNNMQRLAVDATGVRVDASTASVSNIVVSSRPQRAGNRLFLRDGRVLDATNGTLLATLTLPETTAPHAVLVDEANSRVLVWMDVDVDQRSVLISYDLATLQPLAYLGLYNTGEVKGSRAVMTTWGTDGVALADGNRVVILSGAFFSTYRGAPAP